jgi:hypothetical protein
MSEPEVQTTIAYVLGRSEVLSLLLGRHRVPDAVALLVTPDIVQLRAGVEHEQVHTTDGDEDAVAAPVARRVVGTIDVCGDDGAELHEHVIQRCIHGAACDSAGVAGAPADLDWVGIRVGEEGGGEALSSSEQVR